MEKDDYRRVILTDTHLLSVGHYERDTVHLLPAALAAYLVAERGFRYVDDPPEIAPPAATEE